MIGKNFLAKSAIGMWPNREKSVSEKAVYQDGRQKHTIRPVPRSGASKSVVWSAVEAYDARHGGPTRKSRLVQSELC